MQLTEETGVGRSLTEPLGLFAMTPSNNDLPLISFACHLLLVVYCNKKIRAKHVLFSEIFLRKLLEMTL